MAADLLILGASVRAAAQSARRARFVPACADLFADVDLAACCEAVRIQEYATDFVGAAEKWPRIPWMYTGALENHPGVIQQISADHPLWGNNAATIRRVRDPWQLSNVLRDAGLRFPETRRTADAIHCDGSWLAKAEHSAGGLHVEAWDTIHSNRRSANRRYFQRRVLGQHVAGVFVANGRSARLLGVTTQRLLDARQSDFRYAGSSTDVPHHDAIAEQFEQVGAVLAAEFCLVGLFGIDAIFDSQALWPVEVNPRYTASVEILERASRFDAVTLHAAACTEARLPADSPTSHASLFAKTIHYAEHDINIDVRFVDWSQELNMQSDWPTIADIPSLGSTIQRGQAVTTLLVAAESPEELALREAELSNDLRRMIYFDVPLHYSS